MTSPMAWTLNSWHKCAPPHQLFLFLLSLLSLLLLLLSLLFLFLFSFTSHSSLLPFYHL
ncbi:hypothetical protein BCR42DRAFT_415766 [Absidia repens]|uniref:Uncharacterized protein n=1 Tax=Absidia repens TaxID=90262 RepID=A0A1X2IFM6_9FUNG|nr:hypothetical protein BCR42DRAFT_415766 [Absidia repens]